MRICPVVKWLFKNKPHLHVPLTKLQLNALKVFLAVTVSLPVQWPATTAVAAAVAVDKIINVLGRDGADARDGHEGGADARDGRDGSNQVKSYYDRESKS